MVQGSAEALEQTRPGEWPKRHKVSSWQVRQIRLRQKAKEQRHLFKSAKREVEESQGEQKLRLEREKSERKHGEKRISSTVKKARFQGGEEEQAKRISLGESKSG